MKLNLSNLEPDLGWREVLRCFLWSPMYCRKVFRWWMTRSLLGQWAEIVFKRFDTQLTFLLVILLSAGKGSKFYVSTRREWLGCSTTAVVMVTPTGTTTTMLRHCVWWSDLFARHLSAVLVWGGIWWLGFCTITPQLSVWDPPDVVNLWDIVVLCEWVLLLLAVDFKCVEVPSRKTVWCSLLDSRLSDVETTKQFFPWCLASNPIPNCVPGSGSITQPPLSPDMFPDFWVKPGCMVYWFSIVQWFAVFQGD